MLPFKERPFFFETLRSDIDDGGKLSRALRFRKDGAAEPGVLGTGGATLRETCSVDGRSTSVDWGRVTPGFASNCRISGMVILLSRAGTARGRTQTPFKVTKDFRY
jgi:hypothetical protein